jgi:hypothetical protein
VIQFHFVGILLTEALRKFKEIVAESRDRYRVPLKQGADTDPIFMVTNGWANGISGVVSQETD